LVSVESDRISLSGQTVSLPSRSPCHPAQDINSLDQLEVAPEIRTVG